MSNHDYTPTEEEERIARLVSDSLPALMSAFNEVLKVNGFDDLQMKSFELTSDSKARIAGACCCCGVSNICCNDAC